jgi:hypothetical protein
MGTGTYKLSGTGRLTAHSEHIGDLGQGTFEQTGGTNEVSNLLILGYAETSEGTYDMRGGSLSAGTTRVVRGSFVQSGGTHEIDSDLELGWETNGRGRYTLSGGSLDVDGSITDGEGFGTLVIDGGELSFGGGTGGSIRVANFQLGEAMDSDGSFALKEGQIVAVTNEIVGLFGTGSFTQSGGTHTAATLRLGGEGTTGGSNGLGRFTLSGEGSLTAGLEIIGAVGTGEFTQTGGTHDVNGSLSIGRDEDTVGRYTLSGGLLSAEFESIGEMGDGSFTQTGGTHEVESVSGLALGEQGTGRYTLSGTGRLAVVNERLGHDDGLGEFRQQGGTHAVSGLLEIGTKTGGGKGIYLLDDGLLETSMLTLERGFFGQSGGTLDATTFTQNGGTVDGTLENLNTFTQNGGTVAGILDNRNTYTYNGGTFDGRLLNRGTVNFGADFSAGNGIENQASLMIQAGRTVRANGAGLDNQGELTVDGRLESDSVIENFANLDGDGEIGGTGTFLNYARFAPGSGFEISTEAGNFGNINLAESGLLRIDGDRGLLLNNATLNLNAASVLGSGFLNNAGTLSGPGLVATDFENDGGVLLVEDGTTTILRDFSNTGLVQLTSVAASLAGGQIDNKSNGKVQGHGRVGQDIVNAGTIEAEGGTLVLGGTVTNASTGLVRANAGNEVFFSEGLASSQGVINLGGGTFDNNSFALVNEGQLSGHGVFDTGTGGLTNAGTAVFTGGDTTVAGDVVNQSQIEVRFDAALFTGDVTNSGIFKTTNTRVTFAGDYTENGTFLSDPSDNFFSNLNVGQSGILLGGTGDRFIVSNDFRSASTRNEDWNTRLADLIFSVSVDNTHTLEYTGADLGKSFAGYIDNFAWGLLRLAAGESLALQDGDDVTGGAIYVSVLELLGGVEQIASITGNGMSIYYDPREAGNDYLGGQTYALAGGGFLAAIPEPGTGVLLAAGLLALGLRRRRGRAIR